jgi:lipopolysaccharide/colanic/teichoic acid biosynthesis glycosyltransferase
VGKASVARAGRDAGDEAHLLRRSVAYPAPDLPAGALPLGGDGLDGIGLTTVVLDELVNEVSGLLAARPVQLLVKRLLDIVLSFVLLVVMAPLLVVTALAVKVSSPGPVFYIDWRVGRGGQLYKMYKFRSMYRDAKRRLDELRAHNEVTGPVFKMRRDPRITPVGRVLRKLSIDEIPQLFNVLAGQMSLVGPRPPLPREYEAYTARQRQRLTVRPGLTCTWQVSGRSDIPFEQWIDMDLEYIRSWTMRKDIALLLRTIPAVLSGRGAY